VGSGDDRIEMSELKSRYRGALLGVALGDALGAGFEGARSLTAGELDELDRGSGLLRYTDDTHMTIALAESLIAKGGFDGRHMAMSFAEDFEREPWRGYGPGPPRVFRLIQSGVPWDEAGQMLYAGGSFGNGAAMRVAPVALYAFPDADRTAETATSTALITHAHELGIEGAVLQALAVRWVLRQPARVGRGATLGAEGLIAEGLIAELRERVRSPIFSEKLSSVRSLIPKAPPQEAARILGHGIEAFNSVPTALYAFLSHLDSFREAVRYAISLGGDTDTIGSMTGALSGARLGEEQIPGEWRERLEDRDRLVRIADSLLELALAGQGTG
jgi:poly(ADP-ribose) glycohydrolase ARH3